MSAANYDIVETAGIKDVSTTIGVADSDLYNASDADIEASFDEMQSLGVNTVRVIIPWADIEKVPPGSPLESLYPQNWDKIDFIVNQAQQRGFSVLGVINATPYYGGQNGTGCLGCPSVAPDPTQYADFAAQVAQRYKGEISAYEVWNEPNSVKSWSPAVDPDGYTTLLKAAYTAIKGADPNAMVVAGVLGAVVSSGNLTVDPVTFVQDMYADGAKGYFDALSYHPYNYSTPFGQQNPSFLSPLQMLLNMRETMLANGDDAVKIWASEYGLPTSLNTDQTQAYQDQLNFISSFLNTWGQGLSAAQLAELPPQYQELAASWKDWIGPAFIYSLRDRLGQETTEQGSFGLFYFDQTTGQWAMKPAAQFIKDLIASETGSGTGGGTGGGGGVAAALAASLQKLAQQVANSVATTVKTAVAPAVAQTVQKLGAQVGNALAQALAAWAASLKNKATAPTSATAAIQAVDSAAIGQAAVSDSLQIGTPKASAAGQTGEDAMAAPQAASATDPAPSADAASGTHKQVATATAPSTDTTAADPSTASDDSKATAPANRKETEDDAKGGDSPKDGDKKSSGANTGAGPTTGSGTASGKHAKGAAKNGTSVDEIKTKLGDDSPKQAGTGKHAADRASSSSAN